MARTTWIQLSTAGLVLAACASSPAPAAEAPRPARPRAEKVEPALPPPEPEPAPKYTAVDPATAPQTQPYKVPKDIQAIVNAKDRTADDRAIDAGRHPGELLAFFGVKPGQKVAELFAGAGYTTELLARAVGKRGTVYGQNTKLVLEKFAEAPWSERLKQPANKKVVRVDRELEEPLPPEAKNLDAVFSVLIYHDTVWQNVDRKKMNAAVFEALKPGGVYAVVDHSGRVGTGSTETQTLHRIEESVVREEIEAAGFTLAEEGNFLRNPQDPRDWNDSPKAAEDKRGTSDRFVLKYIKPKK